MSFSPALKRRDLAKELRRLRGEAGYATAAAAARQVGWELSKLSRIEAGRFKLIDLRDVRELLDAYDVTDDVERERLLQMARDSRAKMWWSEYADVFQSELPDLEAGATGIRAYELLCVPGLLQTPDYAAGIMRAYAESGEDAVARRVAARMKRQEILVKECAPTLHVVLDEAALAKPVGGHEVLREQVRQLVQFAAWPNITIQLIPNAAGAHQGMCAAFTILEFADAATSHVVYAETPAGPTTLERSDDVENYMRVYDRLMATALSPEDTLSAMRVMAGAQSEG